MFHLVGIPINHNLSMGIQSAGDFQVQSALVSQRERRGLKAAKDAQANRGTGGMENS